MRYKVNDPEATEVTTHQSQATWPKNGSGDIKKSKKEKALFIIVAILVMAVMALIATVFLQRSAFRKGDYKEMCQTKPCVETALRVLDAINNTIQPCDDFFEFACRGWMTKNPIPHNDVSWDPISMIRDQVVANLKAIVDTPDKKEDGRPIKLARAMYRTCMDWNSVDKLGMIPLNSTLEKFGLTQKPPTDEDAINLDIPRIVGIAQRYSGLDILVEMYIGQDMRDSTRNRLMANIRMTSNFIVGKSLSVHGSKVNVPMDEHLREQSQSLDMHEKSYFHLSCTQALSGHWDMSGHCGFEIYLRDPVRFKTLVDAQRRYLRGMIRLSGAGDKTDRYTTELMNFMTELAKISSTPEERSSDNHRIYDTTIERLQQMTDHFASQWNWTKYLNGVFEQTDVTVYPKNDTAVIVDMSYFKALPLLMDRTSRGIIARYVWWRVYSAVAPQTAQSEFHELGLEFWKTVYGLKSGSARAHSCTRITNSYFGMALTAAYVEKHFSLQEKKKAMEMWADVSSSFDEMLTEIKWMDVGTKARAHRKLLAMRPFIGFPEWVTRPEKLAKYYEEIKVFEGRLYDTFMYYNLIAGRNTLNSWREKTNRNRWITSGTTVNAFYSATLNSVTFPAAILHAPLYGNGVEALNYGAIGAIMGHELTHGFDNHGRRYDENGNVREWWSETTLQHYLEKVECIIKQYTGYEVTQLGNNYTVNGVNTQGENIADNGGLREAFRAYKKMKGRSRPQEGLPGLLKYSDEQLFFLGFAQMWCGAETDGYLRTRVVTGQHSPNRFRVIGTLQNNAEFAKAWKCPRGSPMNPKHKCIVW